MIFPRSNVMANDKAREQGMTKAVSTAHHDDCVCVCNEQLSHPAAFPSSRILHEIHRV